MKITDFVMCMLQQGYGPDCTLEEEAISFPES